MNCDESAEPISALIDYEIAAADRTRLDEHLAGCAACRSLAESLTSQHGVLERVFAVGRDRAAVVAERAIRDLHQSSIIATGALTRPRGRWPWRPMLLSAAAGFALAVVIFRPWDRGGDGPDGRPFITRLIEAIQGKPPQMGNGPYRPLVATENPPGESQPLVPSALSPAAQLVVAKGLIETLAPGRDAWEPLATGGAVSDGARVRTGAKGRCEFRTRDGSEVRLNGDTEIVIAANRKIELVAGQLWSNVAKADDPYEVRVPRSDAKVTALGTQFDLQCTLAATAVLTVFEGLTRVDGAGGTHEVKRGQRATISGGDVESIAGVRNLVAATSWVHEILMMKGRDNPELAARMNDLFAQIGESKLSFMAEKDILALGDHCVLPLTRFIQSERSQRDSHKRIEAARILAKIAQPWSIPDLIDLLGDNEKFVRFYAAKSLERLADGENQGLAPESWRDAADADRAAALGRWRTWWQENKDNYPEAP